MVREKKSMLFSALVLTVLFSVIYYYAPIHYTAVIVPLFFIGLAVMIKPLFGLGLTIFSYPYLPDMLSLLILIGVSLICYVHVVFDDEYKFEATIPGWIIAIFVLMFTYNTLTSMYPGDSLRDFALNIGGIMFLVALTNMVKDKNQLQGLIFTLVLSATLVALYGLLQSRMGIVMDDAWLDVENSPDVQVRVYSVFLNPNILAEYLIAVIPLGIAMFWVAKKPFKKLILAGMILVMVLALVLTMSRGGWLGFAFSIFIFILLVRPKWLIALIPIGFFSIPFLPASIASRLLSITNFADSSIAYRFKMWDITLEIIEKYWTSGVGFGHLPFKRVYETYIRTMPIYHSHNSFLQTAAEQGLPGLLIFIAMFWLIMKYTYLAIKDAKRDSYQYIMGAGMISSLACVLMHGMFENILYIPRIIFTFWILIGFMLIIVKRKDLS